MNIQLDMFLSKMVSEVAAASANYNAQAVNIVRLQCIDRIDRYCRANNINELVHQYYIDELNRKLSKTVSTASEIPIVRMAGGFDND